MPQTPYEVNYERRKDLVFRTKTNGAILKKAKLNLESETALLRSDRGICLDIVGSPDGLNPGVNGHRWLDAFATGVLTHNSSVTPEMEDDQFDAVVGLIWDTITGNIMATPEI